MIDHSQFDDLLALQFLAGGRFDDGAIDCLGVTLEMARRRVRPLEDPWHRLAVLHAQCLPPDHLFSPGWSRVEGKPVDDDVLLLPCDGEMGAGYVLGDLLYSANRRHGVFRLPVARFRVHQLWRYSA